MSDDATNESRSRGWLAPVIGAFIYLITCLVSLPFRHFYDDEITNLNIIAGRSVSEIWELMNRNDVHPPLSYALNAVSLKVFGWPEAILILPLLLCFFAVWYFLTHALALAQDPRSKALIILWTALNPTLLIWGLSLRWYGYWMPLALVLVTAVLVAPRMKTTIWIAAGISVVLFYLSYLTIVLLAALILVELLRRKGRIGVRPAIVGTFSATLIAPQFLTFVQFHLPESHSQSSASVSKNVIGAILGTIVGPTVFPFRIVALVLVLTVFAVVGALLIQRFRKRERNLQPSNLTLFTLIYLAMLLASGLLVKDRNALISHVLLFSCLAVAIPSLPRLLQTLFVAASASFLMVSTRNSILKVDTAKGSLNLPVRETLLEIGKTESPKNTVVVTWDVVLNYYCKRAGLRTVCPPLLTSVDKSIPLVSIPDVISAGTEVVLLETGQSALSDKQFSSLMAAAKNLKESWKLSNDVQLGVDNSARLKSKLSGKVFPSYYVHVLTGTTIRDVQLDFAALSTWKQD